MASSIPSGGVVGARQALRTIDPTKKPPPRLAGSGLNQKQRRGKAC
jgi:hypothetical protein